MYTPPYETAKSATHRVLINTIAPRGARVVHEDVQHGLARAQLAREPFRLLDALQVCGERDAAPWPECVQLLLGRGARLGRPCRDVHLFALAGERARGHGVGGSRGVHQFVEEYV